MASSSQSSSAHASANASTSGNANSHPAPFAITYSPPGAHFWVRTHGEGDDGKLCFQCDRCHVPMSVFEDKPMDCTPSGDGEQMLRTLLTSRQSDVKVLLHDDVTDPAEYFIRTLVDSLREWRQRSPKVDFRSTGASFDTFRRVGKANELLNRLTQLGFFFVTRPDGEGGTKLDTWKPASDRIDPASELGRMIGTQQPAPASASTPAPATDPVADFVHALVAAFREWRDANPASSDVFKLTFQSSGATPFHACLAAGKLQALTTRIRQLGFQSTMRPTGKRQALLDVSRRAGDPIHPSSDLARMLGLVHIVTGSQWIVELSARKVVDAYRTWLASGDGGSGAFQSQGFECKSDDAVIGMFARLHALGFDVTPIEQDPPILVATMDKAHIVDPASELGRLLAQPAPESQVDKVADKVDYVNREFTRWLLANDGAPVGQFLSTAVYFGGLSDADGTLLRRAMRAHGWHADPAAIGVSPAFAFFRRTPPTEQQQQ